MTISDMPTSANILASRRVAHLCFVIPASSCNFMISAVLCVFVCGRSLEVSPLTIAIARFIFSLTRFKKTIKEGLGILLLSRMK